MRFYPGIKAQMGRWEYYLVKMRMKDLAREVKFAADTYDSPGLGNVLQRTLQVSRAKNEIVDYLANTPDRFFNSIVIAAIGGEPRWIPVSMDPNDPRLDLFRDDTVFQESFGILKFTGEENYYALDGQHRLKAISELMDPTSEAGPRKPQGFENEEISIVLVVPKGVEAESEFRLRFRRLFGNLNRYAKKMDEATNIIMDEDDAVAIGVRTLLAHHSFFSRVGRDQELSVVDTGTGKSMKPNSTYFTNIETLYAVSSQLLTSRKRVNFGWAEGVSKLDMFKRHRPSDLILEAMTEELDRAWTAIVDTVSVVNEDPLGMRDHKSIDNPDSKTKDNILFWPVGQTILGNVSRALWDEANMDESSTLDELKTAIRGLGRVNWDFGSYPFRNLIITKAGVGEDAKWNIRSDKRKESVSLVSYMLTEVLLASDWQDAAERIENAHDAWLDLVISEDSTHEEMWDELLKEFSKLFV